ncbi:very short patch repair endonuclease [Pseudodesulfovibrio sp. S3-i]|uniref:very short patch repair endonuclease n=1 Tax=Pseudodesulfovibrio sp. S3-i TaxID=2929474 RepID=UPI001FBA2F28|nr:very short patch repair endonuclease [Pseudodesulfovibrio sp. S3]
MKTKRSSIMSSIVSKDTKPEIQVRKLLHALGYRFRLHRKDLPGTPDIVLPRRKSVIFVHGCFWHLHPGCKRATMPKTNVEFWEKKLKGNVSRDAKAIEQLQDLGYRCLVIWECETKNLDELTDRLTAFLPR